jgi:tRNA threonylcarbamoyladenosine biosynthesis protein TsaE
MLDGRFNGAMKEKYQFTCKSVDELEGIAGKLLDAYPGQRIFALYGEMGSGKTTFIKAACKLLQVEDTISSPTFAIVNVYKTADDRFVNHFDCYRMKSIEEAYDIGYEDYFYADDYCFIEWPEIVEPLLPEKTVIVKIQIDKATGIRTFSF